MNYHNERKHYGAHGEQHVIDLLKEQGCTIQAHNYRTFGGEIDIIAQQGNTLIFMEVKTRHAPLFDLTALISYTKQKKIITTAKFYCSQYHIVNMTCRFDVALVLHKANNEFQITIIENAFTESTV